MPNEVVARDLNYQELIIDLDELKARDWAMVPGVQIIIFPSLGGAVLAFDWAFLWRARWFARGAIGRTEQEAVDKLKLDDPIIHYMEIGPVVVRSAFQNAGLSLPKNVVEAVRKAAAPKPKRARKPKAKQLSDVEKRNAERNAYIIAEAKNNVSCPVIAEAIQAKWPRNPPLSLSSVEKIAHKGLGNKPRTPGRKPG